MNCFICKSCNGSSIEKDGDLFVCKSCGAKYKIIEADKILSITPNMSLKTVVFILIAVVVILTIYIAIQNNKINTYITAISFQNKGQFKEAITNYEKIKSFKDSKEQIEFCNKNIAYSDGIKLLNEEKYTEAIKIFEGLGNFKDCNDKINYCKNILDYDSAVNLMLIKNRYEEAKEVFKRLGDYKNSLLYLEVCNKNLEYNKALAFMLSGDYASAKDIFKGLRDFKDIENIIKDCDWGLELNRLKEAKVGDIVNYGHYEQDEAKDGNEPIEWVVLENKDNRLFLLSKYGLESKNYNDTDVKTDWENCSIRKWLNEDFCSQAFNQFELNNIDETNIMDNNIGKIFLLSLEEFENYIKYKEELKPIIACEPTELVKHKNDYNCEGVDKNDWRLRTLLYHSEKESEDKLNYLIRVNRDKQIQYFSINQYCQDYTKNKGLIRPAMWISLDFKVDLN